MSQNEGFIQHARNGGEVKITVTNGKKFKLDGYCYATNTAYEFHGCSYHGCQYCYEGEGASHRFRKFVNAKGKEVIVPIKFGELYTYTHTRGANGSEKLDTSWSKCGSVSGMWMLRKWGSTQKDLIWNIINL